MGTIKRMARRTLLFFVLTCLAFLGLEVLVRLGQDQVDLVGRFPELLMGLKAAAILAWAEISIMWIRVGISPRLDVQTCARVGMMDARGAALVYATQQFTWAVRLIAFIVLYGVL